MTLTCNAVGDVLALIHLAIDIAKFLNDCHGAPAECRALCNELRSLERLLALSKPTILALRNEYLRELVKERLQIVSTRIEEGLQFIINFDSAFDVSVAADSAQCWRTTMLRWATKTSQSIKWRLRQSADAAACRVAIAQSVEPLIFSLLVAFQADQKAVLGALQEAFTGLTDEVKVGHVGIRDIAAGQEALQADFFSLKEAFEEQQMALQSVREDVSSIRVQFAGAMGATRLDIAEARNDLILSMGNAIHRFAQENALTRGILESFFITVSDNRLAGRGQLTLIDSKLDQVTKLLMQREESTANNGLVLHRRFPGVQQLCVAVIHIQELSSIILPAIPSVVFSDEAIITAVALATTACSSADRVTYGIAAFLLFVGRKVCQMYKAPVVVHVVFVEDFFGFALEIPIFNCSNPQDFHAALIGNFEGRLGFVLIQRRKYELERVDFTISTQQALPWTWEHPIEPGARIHMNTFVQRFEPDGLLCPACSARGVDPDQLSVPGHGWVACTFCRTMVRVTRQEAQSEPIAVGSSDSPSPVSGQPMLSETPDVDSEERAAIQRCRRIRVIQQRLPVLRRLSVDDIQSIESSYTDFESDSNSNDEDCNYDCTSFRKVLADHDVRDRLAATEGFSAPPTLTANGPDEIAQFRLMAQRSQNDLVQTNSPTLRQDLVIAPRISVAVDAVTPLATVPNNQPYHTQQEYEMSGLLDLLRGGADPVLHSADVVKPSLVQEAIDSPASAMEFESRLACQSVATLTSIAPQRTKMGVSSIVDMGAGYQHSDMGSKGVLSPTSTRTAAIARPFHKPTIINASGYPPQERLLFRALGGVRPAAPVNILTQAAPKVSGHVPHDFQTLHRPQTGGLSPFDHPVLSKVETRAQGAALADMRGRSFPGSAEHSHSLDALGAGFPERISTSPSATSAAANSEDGPRSPGHQAGISPKGRLFARFFAQQPFPSATPSPQTVMPHQKPMQRSQQQQQLAAAQQAYLRHIVKFGWDGQDRIRPDLVL